MPQTGPQPHGPYQPASPEPAPCSGLIQRPARAGAALLALLLTTGCHHRGFTDSTVELLQSMRGGIVAGQRPPPPGQYSPYPHVGLTPTTPPSLPSAEARALLTSRLISNRNLTYRTMAANGSLLPVIPPLPSAAPAAPAPPAAPVAPVAPAAAQSAPAGQKPDTAQANQPATLPEGVNGAIMDAATAPPPPPPAPSAPSAGTGTGTGTKTTDGTKPHGKGKAEPAVQEVAMPTVSEKNSVDSFPADLIPPIPDAPPPVPDMEGTSIPSPPPDTTAALPAYDLGDIPGTGFHFLPQSDELSSGQDDALNKLLGSTPNGPFYIRGFGNAASMSAQDQADAVRLGLLRATRLARMLLKRGVPASALHVRGDAFGTGAKIASTP